MRLLRPINKSEWTTTSFISNASLHFMLLLFCMASVCMRIGQGLSKILYILRHSVSTHCHWVIGPDSSTDPPLESPIFPPGVTLHGASILSAVELTRENFEHLSNIDWLLTSVYSPHLVSNTWQVSLTGGVGNTRSHSLNFHSLPTCLG